jgi:rubrerythrin
MFSTGEVKPMKLYEAEVAFARKNPALPGQNHHEERRNIMPRAKRWQCTVCGYLHEDAAPPKVCPTCGVEASRFVLFK